MKLNLYRIDYKPIWDVGGGFAYVLAVDDEEAKSAWLGDPRTPKDGEERFRRIYEIPKSSFYNRAVLINENGDY